MNTENNPSSVYQILHSYGLDKRFIKEILLPNWWDDEIANSKTGYYQMSSIIAKNLGIDVSELLNRSDALTLKNPVQIKYKYPKNSTINKNDIWPNSLAFKISEIIEQIYMVPFQNISNNSIDIRQSILQQYGKLDLANTLEFLWSIGIPVLHVPVFPKEVNKMDGMAVNLKDRPIIILSKNRKHDAWLLFILAHELGHIVKGHLSNSERVIFDLNLESEEDHEEIEANEFAVELLNDTKSPKYLATSKKYTSAYELVNDIRRLAKNLNIDPGVIALQYAYQTKNYPLAEQTLKILYPKADAVTLVKTIMKSNLNLEKLSDENYDYFTKLTSLSED